MKKAMIGIEEIVAAVIIIGLAIGAGYAIGKIFGFF